MEKYKRGVLVTAFISIAAVLSLISASPAFACLNPDDNFTNECTELGYYTDEQGSVLYVRGVTGDSEVVLFQDSGEVIPEQPVGSATGTDLERQLQYFGYFNYRVYYNIMSGGTNTALLVDEDNKSSGVLIYMVGNPAYPANSDGDQAAYQEEIVRTTVSVVNDPENPPTVDSSGNPIEQNPDGTEGEDTLPDCNTEGGEFSWLACPIIRGMLGATQFITNIMDSLLQIQPLSSDDTENNALFDVWRGLRNVALAFLVIAVLIAIFGQALSLNIDAYTMKKMMPRIAIVAIGIMLSYYFAALLIDIFNVLGNGIQNLMFEAIGDNEITVTSGGKWAGGILAALGAGGAIAIALNPATLATIGLILLPVVMAFLTALLIIILRQVIIVGLIVVSPLAMTAWLLPNTEQYFKRWYSLFFTMLMMYPIIMILLGAGSIYAVIVTNGGNLTDPSLVDNNFVNYLLALAGIAVSMAAVPFTLKAAGGLLGRIAGVVNDPNRGLIDRTRKGLQARREFGRQQRTSERLDALRSVPKPSETKNPLRKVGRYAQRGYYKTLAGEVGYGRNYKNLHEFAATEKAFKDQKDIESFRVNEELSKLPQGVKPEAYLQSEFQQSGASEARKTALLEAMVERKDLEGLTGIYDQVAKSGDDRQVAALKRMTQANFGKIHEFAPQLTLSNLDAGAAYQPNWGALTDLTPEALSKLKPGSVQGALEYAYNLTQSQDESVRQRGQDVFNSIVQNYAAVTPEMRSPELSRDLSDVLSKGRLYTDRKENVSVDVSHITSNMPDRQRVETAITENRPIATVPSTEATQQEAPRQRIVRPGDADYTPPRPEDLPPPSGAQGS